jgi:hypothetical protein
VLPLYAVESDAKTLREFQPEGKLQGILSLNDLALAAVPEKAAKSGEVTLENLAQAM